MNLEVPIGSQIPCRTGQTSCCTRESSLVRAGSENPWLCLFWNLLRIFGIFEVSFDSVLRNHRIPGTN